MCPNECPGLHEVYGEEFNKLYETYEKEGKGTYLKFLIFNILICIKKKGEKLSKLDNYGMK